MTDKTSLPTTSLQEIAQKYNDAIRDVEAWCSLARSTKIQKQQIEKLNELKTLIKRYKYGAIEAQMEEAANALFHLQCALNAYISLLNLLRAVKSADYHHAWDFLIEAQEYISVALRARDDPDHLIGLIKRLEKLEQVIFPHFPLYNSIGTIIRGGTCTVCSQSFGACEHIEGRVYWGKLCVRVNYEVIELDHSAVVEVPRDRRCIITEISSEDGWMLDNFTRNRKRKVGMPEKGTAGHMAGILFHTRLIEVT